VNFIDGTIRAVREIVIVIPDLYFSPGESHASSEAGSSSPEAQASADPSALSDAAASTAVPGFERIARFGRTTPLTDGWRPWLANWLGRDDLTNIAPAAIAATTLATSSSSATSAASSASTPNSARAGDSPANTSAPTPTAWLATPMHLIAGLTSVHLDRRSLLSLSPADLEALAQDFNRTFGADSDFHLTPLGDNQLLMQGPSALAAATTEPARALASDLEASLPRGSGARALKRLGAELEMWLHVHPLNEARRRRGELPVSTLWVWGGGPPSLPTNTPYPTPDLAFGSDSYLAGLWRLHGAQTLPLPHQLGDLLQRSAANHTTQRAALVAEITPLLHANPRWTVFEALAELERRFLSPALTALEQGAVASVVVLVNDRQLHIQRRDRLKFWRRRQPGLTGLQG
jgi:hypothetical protein